MSNRTFTMIKPDATRKGHTGAILEKINAAGFIVERGQAKAEIIPRGFVQQRFCFGGKKSGLERHGKSAPLITVIQAKLVIAAVNAGERGIAQGGAFEELREMHVLSYSFPADQEA